MPRTITPDQHAKLDRLVRITRDAAVAVERRDRGILDALDVDCSVAAVARATGLDSGTVRAIRDRRAAVGA